MVVSARCMSSQLIGGPHSTAFVEQASGGFFDGLSRRAPSSRQTRVGLPCGHTRYQLNTRRLVLAPHIVRQSMLTMSQSAE